MDCWLPCDSVVMAASWLQVISMIKSSALCGSAIIAYLQAKGYPEVSVAWHVSLALVLAGGAVTWHV